MPAAVLNRRTAAAILGLLALGAVSRLPWWQRWVDVGGSSDVTRWNAWQASGLATSALVLAGLALAAGAWMPRGAVARFRYGAALTAWVAVLLLAVQAFRLRSPSDQGGAVVATLTDVQGLPTEEELGIRAGVARPDLHVTVEGAVRADLGFGAYLGAFLVLVVAVLLTVQALRRPVPQTTGPDAPVDPVTVGGIVLLGIVSLLPWWQRTDGSTGSDAASWSVWEVSRTASAAVILGMLAVLLAGRLRPGARRSLRLLPVAAAWAAALLLAARWYVLDGSSIVPFTGGIQYVRAQTPEYLTLVENNAPVLIPSDGPFHAGLGYGAYLGGVLVLAIAVVLTVRAVRRPAAEPGGPGAESAGPAAG